MCFLHISVWLIIDIYNTFEKRQEIPKGELVYLFSQGRRSLPRETRLTSFPVGISCLFSKVLYVSFTYRHLQFQNLTLKNCHISWHFFYSCSLFNMARGVTEKSSLFFATISFLYCLTNQASLNFHNKMSSVKSTTLACYSPNLKKPI